MKFPSIRTVVRNLSPFGTAFAGRRRAFACPVFDPVMLLSALLLGVLLVSLIGFSARDAPRSRTAPLPAAGTRP